MTLFQDRLVMPDNVDVAEIAEEALQAAFKVICDRLTEATGEQTWGDMDPLASHALDQEFIGYVHTMGWNNAAIVALQPDPDRDPPPTNNEGLYGGDCKDATDRERAERARAAYERDTRAFQRASGQRPATDRERGWVDGRDEVPVVSEHPYEIICGNGDRAEADTLEAALVAAATLADDAADGIYGAERIWRKQLVITRDGIYDGKATMAARRGERGHVCDDNAVPYESDGPLGHGWECGICGTFLQAG